MELELRRDWDLYIMIGLTLALIPVIYLFPDSTLRTIIGLPFLLFFPGYLAIAALFPRKDDLDSIERVALSFGLSIAITPLIGFGLNYTPWGIRLDPILFSISGFNILVALAALQRRGAVLEPYLPFDPFKTVEGVWNEFQKEQGLDKALSVILALSILSSVVALAYVIAFPRQGESFTEFYILGPDGKARDYPNQLLLGEEADIIIGLANHEHRTMNYTIVIWLVDMEFVDGETRVNGLHFFEKIKPPPLEHVPVDIEGPWTKQWEMNYTFSIDEFPGNVSADTVDWRGKIWFSLYKEDHERSYVHMEDYSDDEEAVGSIIEGVKNKRLSLNLNLHVSGVQFHLATEGDAPLRTLNLTVDQKFNFTMGISNHMFRTAEYHVVVWIAAVNATGNTTVVEELYHVRNFSTGPLPDVRPIADQNITAQWEEAYEFSVNTSFGGDPWVGQLWFELRIDDAPPAYGPLEDLSTDDTATERMVAISERKVPAIGLPLVLNPA